MKDKPGDLEEFHKFIDAQINLQNNTPNQAIDNLSPNELSVLIYTPFDKTSRISINKKISSEVIESIPFVKLLKEFLILIQQNQPLKLTLKGNLPRKTCQELYNKKILPEDLIERGVRKLNKEADSIVIQNLNIISSLARFTKISKNKMSLSASGKRILAKNQNQVFFQEVFLTYFQKFNLGYHDAYPKDIGIQQATGYTLYLLLKYGETKRPFDFYVDKMIHAFPSFLNEFTPIGLPREKQYEQCYKVRAFDRFLSFFGFTEITKAPNSTLANEEWEIRTTELFQKTFALSPNNIRFLKLD
jgi:hypothetical protein